MTDITSLKNHLLIAMPGLNRSAFDHAVICVCEHQEKGAVGLIVNQPLNYPLGIVFDQLNIQPKHVDMMKLPLLYGGPIQPERGFVIHKQVGNWRSSLHINNEVNVTTSNDIISAIAKNKGPRDVLVTLGYSSWEEKQLEKEVAANLWLISPFNSEVIYDLPFEDRWQYAGSLIGIDMTKLTTQPGHA